MQYTEVAIKAPEAELDSVSDALTRLGCSGFVIENETDFKSFLENNRQYWDYVDESLEQSFSGISRIKCWLTNDAEGRAQLGAILALGYETEMKTVDDSEWENKWQDSYKPLEIGRRFLVVPEWDDTEVEGRVRLRLDPGLMFGTGSHPTTRMCLEALESFAGAGKRALDLGCGSGILGIGAILLGCDSSIGADIDPKAPDIAGENAALNGILADRISFYAGDVTGDRSLRKMLGTGYDIVLANIVSDVIISLSPHVRGFMAEGGVFIASGIIDGRENDVSEALIAAGFEITEHLHEEEWHCFVCR